MCAGRRLLRNNLTLHGSDARSVMPASVVFLALLLQHEDGDSILVRMGDFTIDSAVGIRDDIRVLRLSGPFTLKGLFEFQSIVRSLSDPIIIIDLTNVPYMDSASVGAIMSVHTSAQRNNRQYALVGVCERIGTLFKVVGLQGVLVTYPTLEEAQEKLGVKAAAN
jgi:anti-anti-sigma factor